MAFKDDEEEKDRILVAGRPNYNRCDNKVCTSKYTPLTFFPVAIMEQFRRFANMYFLIVGLIMFFGEYTPLFETAVSPWTTLGPLAIVISFSLLVEGSADAKRHRNDDETNNHPCVVLSRGDDVDKDEGGEREESVIGGKDVLVNLNRAYFQGSGDAPETPLPSSADKIARIAFQKVRRMDIRQGHFVYVKNRDMVPADIILMGSSSEEGSAYIETSSIDGETNLKLRTSPRLPKEVIQRLRQSFRSPQHQQQMEQIPELDVDNNVETLEQCTKRITRFSALAFPDGISVLKNPNYKKKSDGEEQAQRRSSTNQRLIDRANSLGHGIGNALHHHRQSASEIRELKLEKEREKVVVGSANAHYVGALTSEPPNPHVNTFTGKLTIPPMTPQDNECYDIPLGAENILLRGAVLRNTEWVIGLVVFTGNDTKLVKNSVQTPSKFSQLDQLMNKTVVAILCIMILCITYLSTQAVIYNNSSFDDLWYIGYNTNSSQPWPYLPHLPPPVWTERTQNWLQYFFQNTTLLTNFVPLSLYITVEFINFCMLWFIYVDLDMYDDTTDTRAVARSTIVTDLGRVQYVFSDKTGTLTQNVMRFKRCSVDGMVFGAPIEKSRPNDDDIVEPPSNFHPLRRLLVGRINVSGGAGLEGLGASGSSDYRKDNTLTFNAEMFLRALSLCHTVVVEKDLDHEPSLDGKSVTSQSSSISSQAKQAVGKFFGSSGGRKRAYSGDNGMSAPLPAVSENEQMQMGRARTKSSEMERGSDGAPFGFAYQAESPDEGALVSAASRTFDFQVISRDSSGIRLRCGSSSIFEDPQVVSGLKNGTLALPTLAAETAAGRTRYYKAGGTQPHLETWAILAINKFDSDRKRMSILLKAPPQYGELTILFCKGADSAMLDPDVSRGSQKHEEPESQSGSKNEIRISHSKSLDADEQEQWELQQLLRLQSHLGDFASEGLRTLVLGMKIVPQEECEEWLRFYNNAATSLKNRDEMLRDAAIRMERDLYIVGATAIEDKLQRGVPETISTLGKAGIKLWVLTGDKRETAVEIGYSTHVLTPKMHLTEVPDNGVSHVRTQMAMEFIRLIKMGRLPDYQNRILNEVDNSLFTQEKLLFHLGKCNRSILRSIRRIWNTFLFSLNIKRATAARALQKIDEEEVKEHAIVTATKRRCMVRKCAEDIIQEYLRSPEGKASRRNRPGASIPKPGEEEVMDLSLTSDSVPAVFDRAQTAKMVLNQSGGASLTELRNLSLAQLTAEQASAELPLVEEDVLSLQSFFPGDQTKMDFDRRKRTLLERMFAVDREVRKGQLVRHLRKDKLSELNKGKQTSHSHEFAEEGHADGPRALVIEGAALKHLLGDPLLEEIIFAVASKCEAVIACRVSPKQKALLVKLVRKNVVPEPVTLAIGDGANDVGMIQEAHVGIGISGKEGKQAVNASDFSIGQFRFLEDLILIHGRWDFFRLSTVVLFSFYKNAVMAGCLITFSTFTVYSGTPLFDEWIIAMLNFVAGIPILVLGLFDRCLSKEYVKSNPQVFKATRNNELMTARTLLRWICLIVIHIFTIFYFTVPSQSFGGGSTSFPDGLMRNEAMYSIGDGEGGDLKSVGTVSFTCLIILLAYKVLFESRSLVHGEWPALLGCPGCKKGENFFSRVAYTWWGVTCGSIGFYLWAITIYSILGRSGPGTFSLYVDTAFHVMSTRSLSWMLILFVPIFGIVFDVCGKVFSNMFYPTQTQIHVEIEAMGKFHKRRGNVVGRDRTTTAATSSTTKEDV